jgi:hypothetical protein
MFRQFLPPIRKHEGRKSKAWGWEGWLVPGKFGMVADTE